MTDQQPNPDNWLQLDPEEMSAYLTGREPSQAELDYESVREDVHRTATALFEAPEDRVQAELARLRGRAEQIEPGLWREHAIASAESLPWLANPPVGEGSPQLSEAQHLEAGAFDVQGTPEERIAEIRRRMARIGELSRQAPPRQEVAILRLNSALGRLIGEIEAGIS